MDTLKIKLNPYKDINIVSLNNKPLSPYSELNNYMKEPFLDWASKLLDAVEREINDDYCLIVTSDAFERLFLEGLQNDFASCKGYVADSFQLDTSISERFDLIKNLASKYGIEYSVDEHKMPVYTEVQLPLDESMVTYSNVEDARLIVAKSEDVLNKIGSDSEGLIAVVLSDKNAVVSFGKRNYLWKIPVSELNTILNSIVDRFVKIPIIVKASALLKNVADTMNEEDNKNLSLATEIDPFVIISELEDVEVGDTITLQIKTFPEESELPNLRLVSQNTSIVAIDGLKITALAPGNTRINIYRDEENIPFAIKAVTTFQNNLVKKIELRLSTDNMGIGRTQNIGIELFPSDAEDAKLVKWSIDNSDVVSINQNGEVTALKEGTATINASTKMASASICVSVLPNIKKITSTVSQSNLYVGQTEPISVTIEPNNCFDSSYEWKTSDTTVAVVEKQNDDNTIIRATGIGKCTLTCVATEGGCSTSCEVSVESTFKKRENAHSVLSITVVLTVATIFCAAFGATIAVLPLAIATAVCGFLAIAKNKSDRFWAFVLVAVSVLLAIKC